MRVVEEGPFNGSEFAQAMDTAGAVAEQRVASYPGVEIAEAPVGSLLLQVIRAHAVVGTEMLRRLGVLPPQELVLMELARRGGSSPQTDLVRFLARDRSTVTKTLQAMERANLVERQPSDSDGRAVVVSLTDKGRQLEPMVRQAWAELEARTVAGLCEDERRSLEGMLASIRNTLAGASEPSEETLPRRWTDTGRAPPSADSADERLRISIVVASTRDGRFGPTVANWLLERARGRADMDVGLIDLRDAALPAVQQAAPVAAGRYESPAVRAFAERIAAADGFVIVTPEYNHGYPAAVKLALDSVYPEWHAKPVGFVCYGGIGGGLRAVEQLRLVCAELHMVSIRETVCFQMARAQFDDTGRPRVPDDANAAAAVMLDQLAWWAGALRRERATTSYPRA
jgi:NAD(P)H-dependent FMN reductase/DNA-binding MarR family transcriptional regulator